MLIIFLNSKTLKSHFCSGLFPSHFLSISELKFQRSGLPNQGFGTEDIAKNNFSRKSFLMNFGVDFCCLLEALGAVFLIFWALKTRLEIKGIL